jgi:NAD(P)-dependent dehydrogenase (short-subunit alcohol dehydrogenase family)
MELGLAGRVVVVLGAAWGIGAAIARAFAAEGARIAAVDRDPAVLDLAGQLARPAGAAPRASAPASGPDEPLTLGLAADVTDFAAIQRVAEKVVHDFGRCDHVVFAVGAGSGKFGFPFWRLEPADWEPVLRINLIGAVNVAHAFAPLLVEAARSEPGQNQGQESSGARSMLFLSSVAGQIGSQTDPPYGAAKAAVINFAQCAAKDLAPYGVRVNTLCPGMVQTRLNRSVYQAWAKDQPESGRPSYEEWSADKIQKLVPLNRWQQPEDIAAMALFLASSQGRNITGQTINVDGGYVMHW